MGECQLNFRKEDNEEAYRFYEQLAVNGVSLADIDIGTSVINYSGIHCADKDARTCIQGRGDGKVDAEEVYEYVFNNYEKYQELIKGVMGRPVPWTLDDMDPVTTFDAQTRQKVQAVIDELKRVLEGDGLKEGTDEYTKRMATGLFWFVIAPPHWMFLYGETFLERVQDKIDRDSLGKFREYIKKTGGFFLNGDRSLPEYSALEALRGGRGKCTEKSKILFAVFKMAGFEPIFVYEKILEEKSEDPIWKDAVLEAPKGTNHACVGLNSGGRQRIFDPSLTNSYAEYRHYYPLSPRQFLSYEFFNNGNYWREKGEYDKAIADHSEAIKLDPKNTLAWQNRGNDWREKGEYDKAITDLSEAIRLDPRDALARADRGVAWSGKREFDKAIADLSEAIWIDPENAAVWSNRGNNWTGKGEYDKAIADHSEAIKLNPKLAAAWGNRSGVWLQKGEFDRAIADSSEVIRLDPKDVMARVTRALAFGKKGEFDKAIADWSEVTRLDPKNEKTYINLVITHMNKSEKLENDGDAAQAIETAKKGLEVVDRATALGLAMPKKYSAELRDRISCLEKQKNIISRAICRLVRCLLR